MESASFPYRLAASDLDGTLLGSDKQIGPANAAAVRALQARDVRFILASGRRHQNSLRFYRQLGLSGPLLSCTGALVLDPDTGRTLHEEPLPPDVADELVRRGQAEGCTLVYYHRDHLYVETRNPLVELYESRVGERAELFSGGLQELRGEKALKLVWYGDPAALDRLRPELEKEFAGRAGIVATDKENLEFMAPGANKAAALAVIAGFYGVGQAATLAFGDGENDAPMLGWAGLGVAMDVSHPAAKAAARLVGPTGDPAERFARAVELVFRKADDPPPHD